MYTRLVDCSKMFSVEILENRTMLSADMVLTWHQHVAEAIRADRTHGGPTWTSRNFAIVQAAVFDTVQAIDHSYEPMFVDADAPKNTSMDAAVASAAAEALGQLYPLQPDHIRDELNDSLASLPNNKGQNNGVKLGRAIADQIIAIRAGDGSDAPSSYTPRNLPGHWQPDPLNPSQTPLGANWGAVTPFVMNDGAQFRPLPPPALTSAQYTAAFNEVKSVGDLNSTTRTAEQTLIGHFWAYDRASMGTPLVLYNQIIDSIAQQKHLSEGETAHLIALADVAMGDAGIAAWDCKYVNDFWRPITAIRNADQDGNLATIADPNWRPLGAPGNGEIPDFTPPFPAYISGHSTFGAATFEVLQSYFGTDKFSFDVRSDEVPGVVRHFSHFSDAAKENGQSRIYLGIHWQFDNQYGLATGKKVADFVLSQAMKPLRSSDVTTGPCAQRNLFGTSPIHDDDVLD
jgi:hypothetical protein